MSIDYGHKYKNARDRLFALMSDLRWHSCRDLEEVAGNRYTARILELKRLGYVIKSENEGEPGAGKRYRLESAVAGAPQEKRVKVFISEEDAELFTRGMITAPLLKAMTSALKSFRLNKEKL